MGVPLLKVVVTGCGYVAQKGHIPAYKKCRNVNLAAICDKNGELAQKIARQFKIVNYYTDFTEMLEKEKPGLVDICTPIDTHAPLAIQAMEAGCHVLTEKPLALNTGEADTMVAAAKKNKVLLSVIHQLLFVPTVQKMKALLEKGVIGKLVRVEIIQSTPPQDYPPIADPNHWYHKLPGGIHGDNLPHPIYIMREFLGNIEPLAVYSTKMGGVSHLNSDEVQVIFKGEKGNGTIISSCNYPSLWSINLYGTKRILHGNINNSYVINYAGKSNAGRGIPFLYAMENLSRSSQILGSTLSAVIKIITGKHRGLPIAIVKYVESIQKGTVLPVTADDGREVVKIWEYITSRI